MYKIYWDMSCSPINFAVIHHWNFSFTHLESPCAHFCGSKLEQHLLMLTNNNNFNAYRNRTINQQDRWKHLKKSRAKFLFETWRIDAVSIWKRKVNKKHLIDLRCILIYWPENLPKNRAFKKLLFDFSDFAKLCLLFSHFDCAV